MQKQAVFDYFVQLKQEIEDILEFSDDSSQTASPYYDKAPNREIRKKLSNLSESILNKAKEHGLLHYIQYRGCDANYHDEIIEIIDYNGLTNIKPDDSRYNWNRKSEFNNGTVKGRCPCSPNTIKEMVDIRETFVSPTGNNEYLSWAFGDVLAYIEWAKELATDNKRRSAIREKLIMAQMCINDSIRGETIDDYIERIKNS